MPKTTYILAVDHTRVKAVAANTESIEYGASYLEKIVQVGIPLPPIGREKMETLLRDGLNQVLAGASLAPVEAVHRLLMNTD